MKTEPRWEDTGLARELRFKPEAQSFWLQYPSKLFVQAMIHEVRERIMKVEFQMGFIRKPPNYTIDFSGRKTPEEVCEAIQMIQDELKDMMDMMWYYTEEKLDDNNIAL